MEIIKYKHTAVALKKCRHCGACPTPEELPESDMARWTCAHCEKPIRILLTVTEHYVREGRAPFWGFGTTLSEACVAVYLDNHYNTENKMHLHIDCALKLFPARGDYLEELRRESLKSLRETRGKWEKE